MSNQLKIEYESLFNTQINFSIYNINGQEIWATERRNRPGKNQFIWLGTSSRGRGDGLMTSSSFFEHDKTTEKRRSKQNFAFIDFIRKLFSAFNISSFLIR